MSLPVLLKSLIKYYSMLVLKNLLANINDFKEKLLDIITD